MRGDVMLSQFVDDATYARLVSKGRAASHAHPIFSSPSLATGLAGASQPTWSHSADSDVELEGARTNGRARADRTPRVVKFEVRCR